MYRLCVYVGNQSKVGRFFNEEQVIQTMVDIANKYHTYSFDIIEVLDNQPYLYAKTRSEEEFQELLSTYRVTKDIPDLSCIELKRLILERANKKSR